MSCQICSNLECSVLHTLQLWEVYIGAWDCMEIGTPWCLWEEIYHCQASCLDWTLSREGSSEHSGPGKRTVVLKETLHSYLTPEKHPNRDVELELLITIRSTETTPGTSTVFLTKSFFSPASGISLLSCFHRPRPPCLQARGGDQSAQLVSFLT